MAQSLSGVVVHLIFATKNREPMIQASWRAGLHAYIGGILRRCNSHLLAINSVRDHIHLCFPLPRTISISDLVKEIKTGSSKWVHEVDPKSSEFRWQAGYGIFSVGHDKKSHVIQYIQSQEEHHRIVSFQEEYRKFLDQYELRFDERYIWD